MKKITSIIIVLSMIFSMLPTAAFAAEDTGLCDHHAEHTPDCGYVAAAEVPCAHEHTAECYTADVLPSGGEDGGDAYELEGDAEQTNTLLCTHVHDDACGYIAAVEAHSCHYECAVCAAQELIDALPDEVSAENADTVAAHLDAIDLAKAELTADELALLDLTKYTAAAQALGALAAAEVTCDCGTDDAAIHATTCAVYVAPETAVCYCTEKCSNTNVWCDVCGFDYTQCGGTDTAVPYAECTCETKCTSDNVNNDCAVCSATGADLTTCTGTDAKASLTNGENVTYYATLEEAVTAAQNASGSTVQLLDSVTLSNTITISTVSVKYRDG